MTSQIRNIASLISVMGAAASVTATAGGAGDGTEVTGFELDRSLIGMPQSAVLAVPYSAVLSEGETLSVGFAVESANLDGMVGATDLITGTSTVVATGPTGGGTVTGTYEIPVALMGAGLHVRAKFTPSLSKASTDTAALSAVFVFGGAERLPQ
jgi:hypothetical protein